jgi:hypothetical protein
LQIKTKIVTRQTADTKPVKQEVNGTVILPPLVFLAIYNDGYREPFFFYLLMLRFSLELVVVIVLKVAVCFCVRNYRAVFKKGLTQV